MQIYINYFTSDGCTHITFKKNPFSVKHLIWRQSVTITYYRRFCIVGQLY